ncbi:hypothetical protein K501DRAFT_316149, partial [Backusella circina FSU 941]
SITCVSILEILLDIALSRKKNENQFKPRLLYERLVDEGGNKQTDERIVQTNSHLSQQETSQMAQSLTDVANPNAIQLVQKNSVFIDINDLKNPNILRDHLPTFNLDEEGKESPLTEYLGHCETTRRYLNRTFLETMWTNGSEAHNTVLNTGFILTDGTSTMGFESFSPKAKIVKVKMEKLPFKPFNLLKQDMEERLSHFGKVLDIRIFKNRGSYTGRGYATLDIAQPEDTAGLERLNRVTLWKEDDGSVMNPSSINCFIEAMHQSKYSIGKSVTNAHASAITPMSHICNYAHVIPCISYLTVIVILRMTMSSIIDIPT